MVQTPTQSFPKFSFPFEQLLSPIYDTELLGNHFRHAKCSAIHLLCVWKYFFVCLEILFCVWKYLFVFGNTFSVFGNAFLVWKYFFCAWKYISGSSSIFTPNLSLGGIFTHARLTGSTQSWSHIVRSRSARKIPLDHRKRDWMNIAEVSITNIRYVRVTEQKNVMYFRGAAR